MVGYTNKKEYQLSCFVSEEEAKQVQGKAEIENRSVSNFIYNILFGDQISLMFDQAKEGKLKLKDLEAFELKKREDGQ